MSDSVLKKFGKYFLLDRIGEGGMAEIFRARLATAGSSGRFVVIKRIQGAFSNNHDFVQMFRAEVQVTMRFTHPNIVQLYEAGEEIGQQYIAMEWVEGRNLRQVLSKISQKQQRIPIPAAIHIIEQAAAGLHYAHAFKDRITGESLNLVHRDVSPQNILVSYDGNIKVIDFGIAKAATNGEATRAGVIKGKLSYLSPEQVMGEVLDGRSDLFALGIVLWELLTGKRLFVAEGDNEFQVLKMIESCNSYVKPPSTYNSEIPKDLDDILMQALSRDPKKRFQTGDELVRALRKVLAIHYSDFGSSDLSTFVKKLFHDLIVEDRKQLQHLNGKAEELIALGSNEVSIAGHTAPHSDSAPQTPDHTRIANLGNKFNKAQINSADKVEMAVQPDRQMKIPARPVPAGTRTGSTRTGSTHTQSPIRRGSAQIVRSPPPVASVGSSFGFFRVALITGMIGFAGHFAYQQYLTKKTNEPLRGLATTQESTPSSAGVAGKSTQMKIRVFPDGNLSRTRATVNSNPIDLNQGQTQVAVGEPLELFIDRPGFVTYRKEFTIKESDVSGGKDYWVDVKLEPMIFGTFTLSTVPELAEVTITGVDDASGGLPKKAVVFKTPIYQEKLPVGHYRVSIKNEILNVEKAFQIQIKEGDRVVKHGVTLEPSRSPSSR